MGGRHHDTIQIQEGQFPVAANQHTEYPSGHSLNPIHLDGEMIDKGFINDNALNLPPRKTRRLDLSAHSLPQKLTVERSCSPPITNSHMNHQQNGIHREPRAIEGCAFKTQPCPNVNSRTQRPKSMASNQVSNPKSVIRRESGVHVPLVSNPPVHPTGQNIEVATTNYQVKKEFSIQSPPESQFQDLDFWFDMLGRADLRPFLYDEDDQ